MTVDNGSRDSAQCESYYFIIKYYAFYIPEYNQNNSALD